MGNTTHILVAGCSRANVDITKAAFEQLEYLIVPAPNMSLALFLAQKNLPDLIICDTVMSDGDPYQFLDQLKADDELRSIPFVFLAPPQLDTDDRRKMLSAGADGILVTPVEPKELLEDLLPYIRQRQATKEEREEQSPE